ncbi:MAG TPA: gamma-glutamyl-gamma-aminobutyrate hydrolase family protein, partial [Ilumatobacter sp.]|nr:gamma-glutamyl-gamma-aminobutyrate hydrolase family protein [Ilumatobacter sp.]
GITGRRKLATDLPGAPAAIAGLEVDLHFATYAHEVIRAGGIPVQLPMELDPNDAIAAIDGLLISGGADIDPARYGADRAPETDVEPARDAFEFGLLDAAHAAGRPVLAVCRGFQVVNVHAGGTLRQHVPEHALWDRDPTVAVDTIAIVPNTLAHDLYGGSRQVNSLHHQTVDAVGPGLVVAGRSVDGTVELLEDSDRHVLALQWHPEMMRLADVDPAFTWLVERARR